MSKCLITGSQGFIGQHLVKELEARGDDIQELDRALFGAPDLLKDTIASYKPDYIFHLAAYGNHTNQNDIDMMIAANMLNLFLLLRQTRDIKYKAFINVSTSSVNLPVQTFYSASKAAGEKIASAFRDTYKKPIVSVRPASVYGPGEAEFRFIPTVIKSIKSGERMTLTKDATHSWIYVEDFVRALLLIASRGTDIAEPINISNGEMFTNIQIVNYLETIADHALSFEKIPMMRDYDTTDWLVGNSTLKSLGYAPKYSIKEGLKKTYEVYEM